MPATFQWKLFGGLDLASGPNDEGPVIGFNDFWRGSVSE